MLCAPAVVGAVVQAAFPVLALTATAPHPAIVLVPSVNATVPPSGTGLIAAVYVTWLPAFDGFADEESVVVVGVTARV